MNKLLFEVDASQIDIKPLLKRDFLELSMRAISSANPNRNNSWFTKEAMEKGISTFKNKPILGYFENGDFVSHNGSWEKDPETKMEYWNTLGSKGERILGLIRSDDEVKIEQDPNTGLYWIVLTCALWTQYSYKQVKRLIKDAKKAKKEGKPAKNISVEVDITDYEDLENGVRKINDFNLVGITILGSRNGVKVEPGIENAELSVIDIMGKEFYEKQKSALRVAYEKLDGSESKNKEDFSEMETEIKTEESVNLEEETVIKEKETVIEEEVAVEQAHDNYESNENVIDNEEVQEETVEEKVITETCEEEDKKEDKDKDDDDDKEEDKDEDVDDKDKDDDDDKDEDKDEDADDEDKEEEQESCVEHECDCCPEEEVRNVARDISWLMSDIVWNIEKYAKCIEYYEKNQETIEEAKYLLPILRRFLKYEVQIQSELSELVTKVISKEYVASDEEVAFEERLSENCDCKEMFKLNENLTSQVKNYESQISELTEIVNGYKTKEFLSKAYEVIHSVENLSEEKLTKLYSECENGTISTIDELKVKVALAATFSNNKSSKNEMFSAPIVTPNVSSYSENKKTPKAASSWDVLREYNRK